MREPKNMVRHHPTTGKEYTLIELDSNDLGIHLYNYTSQPTPYAVSIGILMVAIYFDDIPYLIFIASFRL